MSFEIEDLQEINTYMELARQLAPVADAIVDVVRAYEPAIKSLLEDLVDGNCDLTARAYNNYIAHGFSKDEAILLTLNSKAAFTESLRDQLAKQKSK